MAAEGEPFGSSYASVLWGRLEPGTRLGYVAALRQFLRYSHVHGWLYWREALEGRLLEIARDGYFEGPVKNVLCGVRMAEKGGVIQSLVPGSDWIFAKSLEKLRHKKNSRRIQWTPSGILYESAAGKGTFMWPEMECIALAASSLCYASERHGQPTAAGWDTGFPRRTESPRSPGARCGAVGREMATLPR